MKKKRQILAVVLLVLAALILVYQFVDVRGMFNEWRHVPSKKEFAAEQQRAENNEQEKALEKVNPYREEILRYKSANKDVLAYLDVPGLVQTPVVQGTDNAYYLNHDVTGASNRNGAAFMDYEVKEKEADNVVIYGHNMANTQVFSNLEKYVDPAFAQTHRFFSYATTEGVWQAEVVMVSDMDLQNEAEFFGFNTWLKWEGDQNAVTYLAHLKPSQVMALDTSVKPDDRLITLSTCNNAAADARILIVARLSRTV